MRPGIPGPTDRIDPDTAHAHPTALDLLLGLVPLLLATQSWDPAVKTVTGIDPTVLAMFAIRITSLVAAEPEILPV